MTHFTRSTTFSTWIRNTLRAAASAGLFLSLATAWNAGAVNLTALPPYLAETKGAPMVMLNLSRDHQLFYKAYNEYSDLDGDGAPETQYKHTYRYYGYFDNRRCYVYSTALNQFTPTRLENGATATNPTYCGGGTDDGASGEWHGNFLNWATMTRMDVVRRILYGGKRSTDNTTTSNPNPSMTVLERAHLPTDAHSFAKYYNATSRAEMRKITPFTTASEITICNTSFKNGANSYSHNAISPPSMLVANGNFALWNSNERWQCYWSETKNATNANQPAFSGLNASANNPSRAANGLGTGVAVGEYTVRVEVCKPGLDGAAAGTSGFTADEEGRCKFYPLGNYKPAGLLQKYGERNEAAFGLMTGSFNKNISGGVLRKNVATFTDEVDLDDGQFKNVDGIVKNLDALRIYGYNYDDNKGEYITGDNCDYQLVGLAEGNCVSWGNPMGEMYLEALRYLAGKSATTAFDTSGGKDAAIGMTVATWSDPFHNDTVASFGDQLCRRTSIVNFNASVTSYDNDQWAGQSDINGLGGATTVESLTKSIGDSEQLYTPPSGTAKKWAIGRTPTDTNEICNDKAFTDLSTVTGLCPEAPTYAGGFKIAGAAMHAHITPIRTTGFTIPANNKRAFRVDTYGVALATGTPRIKVAVPGQAGKFVVILPAYRLVHPTRGQGGGTLVDFRVVSQTATYGKYVVQWEDSEQGGDYDQDVWGTLEYNVVGSNIQISTQVIAEATANPQGFGYVISGTNGKDGVHFHSGIRGFNFSEPVGNPISVSPTTNAAINTYPEPDKAAGATIVNAGGGCNSCDARDDKTTATYAMVGVSGEVLQDPLWYAAKYGGYDRDKYTGTSPVPAAYVPGTTLLADAWDSKKADGTPGSDGVPDSYFYAIDPGQLERSLEQIFSTILKAGGAAPAAATSSRTAAGGYVYVSTHSIKAASTGNDADASGEFLRYSFQSSGSIAGNADWDAGAKLTTQVENTGWNTNRRVFTMHTSTGPTTFRWASLSSTQQDALKKNPITGAADSNTVGQQRLQWLRGSASQETATGLRKRTKTKLGAIINSTPWYIGKPSAGYTNVDYGGGYNTFRTDNAARNSVFVAANDGMVHAFNGDTGVEQFAYVPRAMYTTTGTVPYTKLSALTDKNYLLNAGTDRVNMDGSVMAADLKVLVAGTPTWKTYLFGSFGRGARGIYALNVTDPASVTTEDSTTAQSLVKWEFTEAADPDMGYITGRTNSYNNGQPTQVGYMANGKWAAIYGNGYNSTSGHAALFIVFADGPTSNDPTTGWSTGTYIKINTGPAGQGPDNGLATPTPVDKNNDGVIDYIYAGDLKGNIWKFDVSDPATANWVVSTQASITDTTKAPIFQAKSVLASDGTTVVSQPVTTAITTFVHPQGGYQLFFGTGKALESTDYPMAQLFSQSLYGLYDKPGSNVPITTGKTDLVAQTSAVSGDTRFMSKNPVDYSTKKGWYLNLPVASEGVIFNPIAEDSLRVNVRSLAPEATSDGCRYDSSSFGATINPINGNPIQNLIPGAPLVTGMGAVGKIESNTFEFSRGGVYKVPEPPVSTTSCIAGSSANCVCNPNNITECVVCTDPSNCKKPWDTTTNQCMYRSIVALGNGGLATSERFGKCTDGRLTWREISRNR